MLRRVLAAAVAATFVLPAVAAAQARPTETSIRGPGFRISPFVGYLTGFTRAEEWLYVEAENRAFVQASVRVSGGPAAGVQLDAPLVGRWGLTAAAAYASRGDTDFTVLQTGEAYRVDGHTVLLGRFGLSLHVQEEPTDLVIRRFSASFFAGGTALHEQPRNRLSTGDALTSGTHVGANFGGITEVGLGSGRVALQLGVEDNMMWWREEPLSSLAWAYFGRPGTTRSSTRAHAGVSHTVLVRAGLRLRL
jgi:hypothetical protein